MIRIGHGYDVHRLVEDRPLIIGGVNIPYSKGLLGHSDADVLIHAVSDAILGALALGDIGYHFPDNDPSHKGKDSMLILNHCINIIRDKGYTLQNLDATIVAEAPKLSSYILKMKENIAAAFCCSIDKISIKATTEEHLGFTGEGLGISAHCVCLLIKTHYKIL